MKEVYGSIWVHFLVAGHIVCITTNGTVKKNGEAVMGRGNAKQATICIPGLVWKLGSYLRTSGNEAGYLEYNEFRSRIVIFPVKHNWWEKADRVLIEEGVRWLLREANQNPQIVYHLPRPGCGNGKLNWEREVKPMVDRLPDNIWVHHLESPAFDLIGDEHDQPETGAQ